MEKPIIIIICAVCGMPAHGRQWWNQDDEYGICPSCAKELEEKYGKAYVEDCYGKEGVHWGIQNQKGGSDGNNAEGYES